MAWLKFRADGIFTGDRMLPPDTVVVADKSGTILDMIPSPLAGEGVRTLEGTLCPGFINTHCHLELSHLEGSIPTDTGLPTFLSAVMQQRVASAEDVSEAMERAVVSMHADGIVAVGDICNTDASIPPKRQDLLQWVNFIEVLSATDTKAPERIQHFLSIRDRFQTELLDTAGTARTSLCAHAPYSTSPLTFQLVNEHTEGLVTTLHNQETAAENELYRSGTGDFLAFYRRLGYDRSPIPMTGRSSLQSVLPHYCRRQRLVLVHNTFTSHEDMVFACEWATEKGIEIIFCLCPNANLYIEGKLPAVDEMLGMGARIVLGTDSLASNHGLSIASEMRTLLQHFPNLGLETVLRWATAAGAQALGLQDRLGTLRKGTRPGLVWLDNQLQATRLL